MFAINVAPAVINHVAVDTIKHIPVKKAENGIISA